MFEAVTLLWRRFSPLEERLLTEVRSVLPAEARHIFDAQVAAITLVQRSPPSWSEVRFYRMRRGRVDWGDVASFPCTDELRLAEVRFRAAGRQFASTLTAIGGHIFDFATSPGPKAAAFTRWDGECHARLIDDPLRAPTGRKAEEVLPAAWENLLRHRSAGATGNWTLYDRTTAHRVALDDGVYLVLAERDGDEFLLHRVEPPATGLFRLPHHDGKPEPLVGELEEFFERSGGI